MPAMPYWTFFWLASHVGHELGEVLGRQVLLDDEHHGIGAAEADRIEVLQAVVGQRFVERDVDRQRAHVGEQQRVAVRRGLGGLVDTDRAAGAADIFDDELVAERLAHALPQHAGQRIGRAARGERHDHGDGLAGIGLRHGAGWQGEAGGQGRHQHCASVHGSPLYEFSLDGYTVFTSSAMAAPTVLVSPLPPRSRVRGPPSTSDAAIARSIASAASG